MNQVPSDIVLMTGDVTVLEDVARWTADHDYRLIFIDTGVPFFPFLSSRTRITLFAKRKQPLGSLLNEILDYVVGGWFFLMGDQPVGVLERSLALLERTFRFIPRLASLTPSSLYGLEQVHHNPLFGTLYSAWAVQNIGIFNSELDAPESLELDWSEKVTSRGWVHMRMYDEVGSVLPMERFLPPVVA